MSSGKLSIAITFLNKNNILEECPKEETNF